MVWSLISYLCFLHQTAYLIMALVFSAPLTVCQGTEAFWRDWGQDAARWIFWHLRHFLTVICRGQARSGEYEEEKGRGGAQGTHGGHGEDLSTGRCFFPSHFYALREIPMLTSCHCFMFFSLTPPFGIILFSQMTFFLLSVFSALKDVLFDSQIALFWIQIPNLAQAFLPWHFAGWGCHHPMPDYPAFGQQAKKPDFLQSCQAGQLPVSFHHHLLWVPVIWQCAVTQQMPWHLLQPAPALFVSGQPQCLDYCGLVWLWRGRRAFCGFCCWESDVCVPRGSWEPACPSKLSLCCLRTRHSLASFPRVDAFALTAVGTHWFKCLLSQKQWFLLFRRGER